MNSPNSVNFFFHFCVVVCISVSFGTIYIYQRAISFSERWMLHDVYDTLLPGSLAKIQYSIFTQTISNNKHNILWKRRHRRIKPKRSKKNKFINAISVRQVDSSVSEFDEETEKISQIYINLQFTSYKQREIFNARGLCVLVTCLLNEEKKIVSFRVWIQLLV